MDKLAVFVSHFCDVWTLQHAIVLHLLHPERINFFRITFLRSFIKAGNNQKVANFKSFFIF